MISKNKLKTNNCVGFLKIEMKKNYMYETINMYWVGGR